MNITIPKQHLLRLATRAAAVAEKKATMPALTMSLLDARDGVLKLAGTDLYLSSVSTTPADVETPGSFAVNATDLATRVKMMPEGPLVLVASDKALTLKAKGSARRYTLRGMPGDDYPPLPKPDPDAPTFTLPAGLIASLIAHTHFAISTDETRPHLNSALLEMEPGLIRMVSTDGHRLSKIDKPIEGGASETLLVPLKAIAELRKLDDEVYASAEDGGGKLTLTRSGSCLFVTAGETTFSVKLVDAQFPPYAQVIPKSTERTIRLGRSALLEAVKAVALASNEKTGGVMMKMAKGVLRITSESPERGEGTDEVPFEVEHGKGEAVVGVNAKYAADLLGALTCDEVLFGTSGELDPMTFAPAESDGFVAVIMPMRI